jgi:bifunctional DNA-binding transcriptional regulator/antitoxin component of YhaV-PrlF toxin-antitoxin module
MIRISAEQLKKAKRDLKSIAKEVPKIYTRALNRSIAAARTELSTETRKRYNIKHGDILKAANIKKAESTKQSLMASIRIKSTRRELAQFKVSPKDPIRGKKPPKFLKVGVMKPGLKKLPGAFLQRGKKSGKVHVLKRAGRSRYPILMKYGPSIPEMAGNDKIMAVTEARAKEIFLKRVDHEMNRALEKVASKS